MFIWPFAYVTNYPALFVLSIADTLGFAGFLAINVVYMSEIMGPKVRPRVMMVCQAVCIFLLLVVLTGIIPHYMFPGQYRQYLWILAGLNILIAVAAVLPDAGVAALAGGPGAPRPGPQGRGADGDAGQPGRPHRPGRAGPGAAPGGGRGEDQLAGRVRQEYVFVTILLLVVMVLGYGGIVYGGASQAFLFLSVNRGYSAGFVFALTAWSGVVSSAVYLLNAFFGDRFERRWTQLFGAILFAGGWWGVYEVHNTAGVVTLYIIASVGTILWLWSMYVYIPNNYPTRMRVAGHRLDRRRRPPRRLGRRPDRRAALRHRDPRNFILFITIPCALRPRRPARDLREEPAPPRARRDCPDRRWAAGRAVRPPALSRGVSGGQQGVTGGPALTAAGLPPSRT